MASKLNVGKNKPATKATGKPAGKQMKPASIKKKPSSGAISMDALREKFEKMQQGSGNFQKLKDGENKVRILPFVSKETGETEVYYEHKTHYINELRKSFECLADHGEECPVCALIEQLQEFGAENTAKRMAARTKYSVNAIVNGQLGILDLSFNTFKDVLAYASDPDYGDVFSDEDGRGFKIVKSGEGLDTEYTVKIDANSSSVVIPAETKDPASVSRVTSAHEIEEALSGVLSQIEEKAEAEVNAPSKEEKTKKSKNSRSFLDD